MPETNYYLLACFVNDKEGNVVSAQNYLALRSPLAHFAKVRRRMGLNLTLFNYWEISREDYIRLKDAGISS